MSEVKIPLKCDRCFKRKPTILILTEGTSRDFQRKYFTLFVCNGCRGIGR